MMSSSGTFWAFLTEGFVRYLLELIMINIYSFILYCIMFVRKMSGLPASMP